MVNQLRDPVEVALLDAIIGMADDEANRLLGGLLRAEADLQQLPGASVVISSNENERDGGVDAVLDMHDVEDPPYPSGRTAWQLKSTRNPPSVAADWTAPQKAYLREKVRDGYDFVVLWTRARPERIRDPLRREFAAAVRSERQDARFYFFGAEDMLRMAIRHPGLLVDFRLTPFGGLLGIDGWRSSLAGVEIPYVEDAARRDVIGRVKTWALSAGVAEPMHLFGTSGVGKSRAALEAFKGLEVADRMFYAVNLDDVPVDFWPWMISNPNSRCILVVDQCIPGKVDALHAKAAATDNRVRLLTIGDRHTQGTWAAGANFLELLPLEEGELESGLQHALGLSAEQAVFVARHTHGYPRLAWAAGQALVADPTIQVDRLARAGAVHLVLDRMLPNVDSRSLLGTLALFTRVGFDGDLEVEARDVSAAFGLEVVDFRDAANRERDVVRRAGRYRYVTPLLLAIWIGGDRARALGSMGISQSLARLEDPSLVERAQEQLMRFGGVPEAQAFVREALESQGRPFSLGDLARSARFLRAAVAVDRRFVVDLIRESFATQRAGLDALGARQEIVWTLQYSLWFEDTFAVSQELLFWMALTEPSDDRMQAINAPATATLGTSFLVHLGGTSVPYEIRVARLAGLVDAEASDHARDLAARLLGGAVSLHEARAGGAVAGGESVPEEWRPTLVADMQAARLSGWRLLVQLTKAIKEDLLRERAMMRLASSVGQALRVLPGEVVLPELHDLELSAKARAKVANEVRMVIRYEELDQEYRHMLGAFVDSLLGATIADQVEVLLSSTPWELSNTDDEELGKPRVLRSLAERIANDTGEIAAVLQLASAGETTSVGQLFEEIALVTADRDTTWETILRPDPPVWAAAVGFISGRDKFGDADWVNSQLGRMRSDRRLRHLLGRALLAVAPAPERAVIGIEAVESQEILGRDLSFLMYGGWTASLTEELVIRLVKLVVNDDAPGTYEAGLSIAEHFVNTHQEISPQLAQLVGELLSRRQVGSPMLDHYVQRLLEKVPLPFEARLELLIGRVTADDVHDWGSAGPLFDALVQEEPFRTIKALTDALIADTRSRGWSRWGLSIRGSHYLSRAATLVGPEAVIAVLVERNEDDWRLLLAHMEFAGRTPDPIVQWVIESSDGADILGTAANRFISTPAFWTGSRVPVVRERLEDARAWSERGSPRFRDWASGLVPVLQVELEQEQLRDAETAISD